MNKRLLDFILSISEDNYDEFIKQTNLSVEGDNNLNLAPIDYSWIDIVEKYIPFLKNAVFNPYQEILDVGDSKKLYENGYYCLPVRYPTVAKNSARLRISLNAALDEADLGGLINQIKNEKRADKQRPNPECQMKNPLLFAIHHYCKQ